MKSPVLITVEGSRPRWTGSRAVERVENCPEGCGSLSEATTTEAPLLRHGGYGAARETIRRSCTRCGWALVVSVSEVKP